MRTALSGSSLFVATAFVSLSVSGLGCAASAGSEGDETGSSASAVGTASIASIALANAGKGACSTNSKGGRGFESSCTGNGGLPEYWCSDFAMWVWAQAGADVAGLTAGAATFYEYGQKHGTLHSTPRLGDAVVFNYSNGFADHVAIVTSVSGNTIETMSGDWGGQEGVSEAHFSSTSSAVHNAPAYYAVKGATPAIMGMTISGFISPVGIGSGGGGGTAPGGGGSGGSAGCYSDTLGREAADNACVQSSSNSEWYQCDSGSWTDRWTDPTPCNGTYPLGNGGHSSGGGKGCYSDTLGREAADNACVQSASNDAWYQCDDGAWTDRWTDPTACNGVYPR